MGNFLNAALAGEAGPGLSAAGGCMGARGAAGGSPRGGGGGGGSGGATIRSGGTLPVVKGQQGVVKSANAAQARGETILGYEITIDVSTGRIRGDIIVRDAQGLKLIESKNGPGAKLTPNQAAAFPILPSQGGVGRGGNAQRAGLSGNLGPLRVHIDWW
jgi:hypothetical protein